MQNIAELLQVKFEVKTATDNTAVIIVNPKSFRASLINQFIERIKSERIGTQWEVKDDKLFARGVALKINTNPALKESWMIESFLKSCKEARSFGEYFYGRVKIKKFDNPLVK